MILVLLAVIAASAGAQDARDAAKAPAFDPAAPVEPAPAVATGSAVLRPVAPERAWLPERERCHRFPGVRTEVCDSPRRVPEPTAEAAERAARLGLGTHEAADRLHVGAPRDEWVAEVGGVAREELLWPVANGLLSRRFGAGRVREESSGTHPGVDVVAAEGTLLRAVDDALVAYADNGVRGMGNSLWLVHADGSVSIYAHCRALRVSAGELVRRGQIVGELGATGLTFRAHLHYELRVRGVPHDPLARFVERPRWRLRVEEGRDVTWLPAPPNQRVDSGGDAADVEEEEPR